MRARLIGRCRGLVWVLVAGVGFGAAADEKAKARPKADLSGSWRLDRRLSDDAQKLRDAMEARHRGFAPGPGIGSPGMGRPGMGGGGRLGPPPGMDDGDAREMLRPLLDPAEELTVYQGDLEIVLDERSVRRRTLHPDGRKYKSAGGASEVKTRWQDGRLVVETRGFRGRKTTESWERAGDRLTATVKVETGQGPDVTIRRVYDRVPEAPGPQ